MYIRHGNVTKFVSAVKTSSPVVTSCIFRFGIQKLYSWLTLCIHALPMIRRVNVDGFPKRHYTQPTGFSKTNFIFCKNILTIKV
jgi:hypothetical protein